jgi:Spy/CpxP family protein refolding chaperone
MTETTRRTRLLAVLTLLVTFLAGAFAGAALDRGRGHGPRGPGGPGGRGGPPAIFAAGSPLVERLELTEPQRDSIERLMRRDRARTDSMFREMRPRLRARFDSTTAAIAAVLTPEQRAEWERFLAERRAHHRRRGGGDPADGPPLPPP